MSNPESDNLSPPLPSRGAYTFNFDDLDEFSNPFQPSHALSNSPPEDKTVPLLSEQPAQTVQHDPAKPKKISSSPTPQPASDSLSQQSELEHEGSPQTVCSAGDVTNSRGLVVKPSGSQHSIDSEDVWCDAEDTVAATELGLVNVCDNLKNSQNAGDQKNSSNKKGGHEQAPSTDCSNNSNNTTDAKNNPDEESKQTTKKSQGRKPGVKTVSSGKSKHADEKIIPSEEEKITSLPKTEEAVDESQEKEKKTPDKMKKISSKVKQKDVVIENEVDMKKDVVRSSKEKQVVDEKDTDTKQEIAVKEEQESVPTDKTTAENEPKRKSAIAAVKRKTKSKLKKPAGAHSEGDGEIQIFAPPKPKTAVENIQSSHQDAATSGHMTQSLEMVHEFGAGDDGEMPEEANEGFVIASEAFTDSAGWEILDKFGGDADTKELGQGRESLFVDQDSLVQGTTAEPELAKRKGQRSSSEIRDEAATNSIDDQLSAGRSVGGSRQTKLRHPAARVLEEKIDVAVSGEPRELNGEQAVEEKKGAMTADGKDAVVHLVQDKKGSEQVLKYSQSDWNKKQQELELEFQAQLLSKEKEWSKKLGDREKRISNLEEQSRHMRQTNDDMRTVITEFEKTISLLQAEKEKNTTASQNSLQEAIRERDQALDDLHSVEAAFAGLHQRYEKTKGIIDGFKQNESVLKKCLEDAQAKLKKSEDKLLSLKKQAEDKFEKVSDELEKERRAHSAEIARLQAAVKKSELQIQGLEMSLQQKIQENQELTSICDELIAKVGVE